MSGLFGSTKAPKISPPQPAPPPPTIDTAAKTQDTANQLRQRRGAAANVLAGNSTGTPQTQLVRLLGN